MCAPHRALFKDRDCFSLVRPMHDEGALANLDSVPKDQLRPEFSSVSAHAVCVCLCECVCVCVCVCERESRGVGIIMCSCCNTLRHAHYRISTCLNACAFSSAYADPNKLTAFEMQKRCASFLKRKPGSTCRLFKPNTFGI